MVGVACGAYKGFLMAFEAIPLYARGGIHEPHAQCISLLFCYARFFASRGGSAKCFKNLLKHLLFFDFCFAIFLLQLMFCNSRFAIVVLQVCFAIVFCNCVLQLCFAIVFCNCVLQLCFAFVFCNRVLQMCPKRRKAQEVLRDEKPKKSWKTKSPTSPKRRKAQEVLRDEKPKKF